MSTVSTTATTASTSASTVATLTGADWPSSDLDAAAAAFDALTRGPQPLSLDCDTLRPGLGLPAGAVSLAALRDWMLGHPDAHAARDAVWRHVITRARQHGGNWLIAAAGLAMPALVGHARSLAVDYRGNPDDLDAAILTGFLTRLRRVDPRRPAVYASLVYAGWRAGLAVRRQDHRYIPVPDPSALTVSHSPELPFRHPDLLVGRAVELKILDAVDADAWIEVRLARRPVEVLAPLLGVTVDALRMRLARADVVLADALADGLLTGPVSPQTREAWATRAARRAGIRAGRACSDAAISPPQPAAA
jgi:hypothetical protein